MVNVSQRSRSRRVAAGRTILQAIGNACQRTLSNPISLAFSVFTLSYFFLEVVGGNKVGPLENVVSACAKALNAKDINTVEKTLLNIISGTFGFLVRHKVKVGVLSAYLVPYSLRPNTTNTVVCFFLAILTLSTSTISVKSHYLFALIFWTYTQVNSPRHRSYVATAGLLTLLIYFEVITIVTANDAVPNPTDANVGGIGAANRSSRYAYNTGPATGAARPIHTQTTTNVP